jgi:thiol-disulfide isomerase/thioredoxin
MIKNITPMTGIASFLFLLTAGTSNVNAAPSSSGLEVGDTAPCIVLRDVQPDSREVTQCIRNRPENTKYILLEFFSVTCSACIDNMPVVSQLANDVHLSAAMRLVAIDRDEASVRQYIRETPRELMPFPIALDTSREAKRAYGIYATPTLFILNQDNQIVYKHIGTVSPEDVATIKNKVNQ